VIQKEPTRLIKKKRKRTLFPIKKTDIYINHQQLYGDRNSKLYLAKKELYVSSYDQYDTKEEKKVLARVKHNQRSKSIDCEREYLNQLAIHVAQ